MKNSIITIATLTYSRALLIHSRLESEGIGCFLSNKNLIQADVAAGVEVRVAEKDAEKALRIVDEMKDAFGTGKQKSVERLKSVRRILVPVDFSDTSINACYYAIGLAQKLKAEVKLLYAYFNPVMTAEPYDETSTYQIGLERLVFNLENEAKKQIEDLIKELKSRIKKEELKPIKITYELDRGVPDDAILDYCKEYKPGMIVIGSSGMGGKIGDIIGSITKRVIRKATVPVLAVPGKSKYSGIKYGGNVLYATNFDDSDHQSIRMLLSYVKPFQMKIHVVHITEDAEKPLVKAKMEELKRYFAAENEEQKMIFYIDEHEDVLAGLDEYIEDTGINLLALTTHKRGMIERLFNPSLARQMLFHSNVPLLVFHS